MTVPPNPNPPRASRPTMKCLLRRTLAAVLGSVALVWTVSAGAAEPPKRFTAEELQLFEKDVRPVLQSRCWKCHGEEKSRGGLRLDSREAALKGGDNGPVVSLQKSEESRLLKALAHEDKPKMPPAGKLPPN